MIRTRRAPRICAALASLVALSTFGLTACKGEEKQPEEKAEPEPEPEPEPDPTPAEPRFDLSGPTPPETSAAVFAVDGALLPIGCFDKDKGALSSGADCVALVAEGSEVYMEDSFGKKALEKTEAGTKNSTCGDEGAIPVAALGSGASYDWAVWPKSVGPTLTQIDPETWSDRGARLEEAESKAIQEAISKVRNVQGDFLPKQKASVDIDGDGKEELFVSAVLDNPGDPGAYLVSGLFMAPGGDLANIVLIDKGDRGKGDIIRLRAVVDLDGDKTAELWTGVTFDGGNGDRIVQLVDGEPKALSKWTCGA
ncbi:hypothetical protein G6O69_06595 [Pseudenhygromyxa sp. WMMC2535]|uniref:hypothetical protein n=1 Tax=Pseudenhygromyxa sp. WMMC2535 TaxID=2712867 RepID=UPI0015532542|nr:hypothetical protein [Pseudenhygromyxa sp. WMMC2535]NVB37494.1 hypothetical protein [Pseudenhygromyxa sp. WMMC2535]